MEDGLLNNSVGFIIQARMQSTRLPGKVLMPMPFIDGEPILGQIINKLTKISNNVVVATSSHVSCEPIWEFCIQNKIDCFKGDENDVLSRFIEIQRKYNFKDIFRFTADNPLIDCDKLKEFYKIYKKEKYNYCYSKGLPLGMNMEVFDGEALIDSLKYVENKDDKEHVTPALKRLCKSSQNNINIELSNLESLRLTIDTPIDYALLSMIFKYAERYNLSGIQLVQRFFNDFPWLIRMNEHVEQIKVQ